MNILITAATKGIGKAILELCAAKGANVCFCARTEKDVLALQAQLQATYPHIQVLARVVDMSKPAQVQAFGEWVKTLWTSIDILVNNAGVFLPCTLSDASNSDKFVQMMDTNLYSAYHLTNALLPTFLAQKSGHIFNMCSIASIMPYGAYSVSKYALLGYSKVLREELKTQGIRVTAILPGATLTDSWAGVDLPAERFMKAEDIAQALWACYELSQHTVVEELVLRPQLGDI